MVQLLVFFCFIRAPPGKALHNGISDNLTIRTEICGFLVDYHTKERLRND